MKRARLRAGPIQSRRGTCAGRIEKGERARGSELEARERPSDLRTAREGRAAVRENRGVRSICVFPTGLDIFIRARAFLIRVNAQTVLHKQKPQLAQRVPPCLPHRLGRVTRSPRHRCAQPSAQLRGAPALTPARHAERTDPPRPRPNATRRPEPPPATDAPGGA